MNGSVGKPKISHCKNRGESRTGSYSLVCLQDNLVSCRYADYSKGVVSNFWGVILLGSVYIVIF